MDYLLPVLRVRRRHSRRLCLRSPSSRSALRLRRAARALAPAASDLEPPGVLAEGFGLVEQALGDGVQPSGGLLVAAGAAVQALEQLDRRATGRRLLLQRPVDLLDRLAHPLHALPDPTRTP